MKKIFAWKERGYWCGQKLVPISAIPHLKEAVGSNQSFATVQTYDDNGGVMFCPVYADLDGKDPKQAQFDAQYITYLITQMTNVIPDIYYSGNKGYHIIIPYKIEHPQCHLIAKHFFQYLCMELPSLDKSVYRTQALLRLPGSPASRPGYYKIQITHCELMTMTYNQIEELAKVPRIGVINEFDASNLNDEFLAIIEEGKRRVPTFNGSLVSYLGDLGEEMTPCLARILEEPPEIGMRNKVVFLLGRLFKKCGFTAAQTVELLLSKPHFQDFEKERGVSSVINSLFKNGKPSVIGCKTGGDADLMRHYCDPFCHFNEDSFDLFGKKTG